jgi:hypothetical protein
VRRHNPSLGGKPATLDEAFKPRVRAKWVPLGINWQECQVDIVCIISGVEKLQRFFMLPETRINQRKSIRWNVQSRQNVGASLSQAVT